MPFVLSDAQRDQFQRDGYLIIERLFDGVEIDLLGKIARADRELSRDAASRRDGAGGVIRLSVRNELGDDIYSAFVRCRRIVDTMERLLDGEVYHYHHRRSRDTRTTRFWRNGPTASSPKSARPSGKSCAGGPEWLHRQMGATRNQSVLTSRGYSFTI